MIRSLFRVSAAALFVLTCVSTAAASEESLVIPDLGSEHFLGISGRVLLMIGLVISLAGGVFGIMTFIKLRDLPVHKSMRDVSELIYATCKTYLFTQGKFILLLELFIGSVMVIYFGWLRGLPADREVDEGTLDAGGLLGDAVAEVVGEGLL